MAATIISTGTHLGAGRRRSAFGMSVSMSPSTNLTENSLHTVSSQNSTAAAEPVSIDDADTQLITNSEITVTVSSQNSIVDHSESIITESQDPVTSEAEDIFKCPLANWSLCEVYAKKKELRKNEALVTAMTKVLGIPLNNRAFTMRK